MAHQFDAAATARLKQYVTRLGTHLKDRRKRESFAIYAFGILGESDRKSVEPIAALASTQRCYGVDPPGVAALHLHIAESRAFSAKAGSPILIGSAMVCS